MLILTRRINESILIGDNIVVKINAIKKQCVKLAFTAPRDVSIMRSELLEQTPKQIES
ncbi:MAG TPA: carbon storage regulator [Candidatus Babeliales bacterium]|nr:carbon storage regulator [Candidatus Babeliales bacterium]